MERWFGNVVDGKMQLSDIGRIASDMWYEIPVHFPWVGLDEFVVMPNHIHGIIIIKKSSGTTLIGALHATPLPSTDDNPGKNIIMSSISPKRGSLSVIIPSYKSAVSKQAHKFDSGFSWQSKFHDRIICTSGQLSRIRKYIIDNPRKWDRNITGDI
jgi:REP element-mobilizing transposase RayT